MLTCIGSGLILRQKMDLDKKPEAGKSPTQATEEPQDANHEAATAIMEGVPKNIMEDKDVPNQDEPKDPEEPNHEPAMAIMELAEESTIEEKQAPNQDPPKKKHHAANQEQSINQEVSGNDKRSGKPSPSENQDQVSHEVQKGNGQIVTSRVTKEAQPNQNKNKEEVNRDEATNQDLVCDDSLEGSNVKTSEAEETGNETVSTKTVAIGSSKVIFSSSTTELFTPQQDMVDELFFHLNKTPPPILTKSGLPYARNPMPVPQCMKLDNKLPYHVRPGFEEINMFPIQPIGQDRVDNAEEFCLEMTKDLGASFRWCKNPTVTVGAIERLVDKTAWQSDEIITYIMRNHDKLFNFPPPRPYLCSLMLFSQFHF